MAMSPWTPTTNLHELRRFGKLLEELGELQAVVARCVIQGINERDPSSGSINRMRLMDELADVQAQINCTINSFFDFQVDRVAIAERCEIKTRQMAEWEAHFSVPTEVNQ